MKALTARQQEVFDLIRDHISQTGMPPTRAEIAQRLGFRSPNAAEEHLNRFWRNSILKVIIRSILPCSSRMLISCCASAGCR